MSSKFDVWGLYARRVEAHEVAAIQASPVQHRPLPNEVSAYFPIPLLHARFEMHGQVDPILRLIAKNGNNMTSNLSAFGLAMRLSEFELRHRFVQSWPGFA